MPQNEAEIQEQIQKEENEYNQLNSIFNLILSKTLWDRAKQDINLFEDIFANRLKQIEDFKDKGKPLLGGSILILGGQGVGKSAFIYRLTTLINAKRLFPNEHRDMHTLLLDLENENRTSALDIIRKVTRLFVDYIDKIAPGQFSELNDLDGLPPMTGVHRVVNVLSTMLAEKKDTMPYIFFFVDDMDYALEIWYDLISQLTSITAFPFISTIYAARPLLEYDMFHCGDPRILRILGDAQKIRLSTLPIRELLIQRLYENAKETRKSWWLTIAERFGLKQDRLLTLLENVAFQTKGQFKYSFVAKLEQFIEKVTNGDAREMLRMLRTCLEYIIKNRKTFKPKKENGFYHFERPLIMELFGNYEQSPIINLNDSNFHSYVDGSPQKSGYPLLFNILEWIGKCEGNDIKVLNAFQKLGHTKETIEEGLKECVRLHLIEPKIQVLAPDERLSIHNYRLTEKGVFHLTHIITWSQYQDKFGKFKEGISREFYKKLPINAMYIDIIEFLIYLVTAVKKINPDKPVSMIDTSLTTLLDKYTKYQTTYSPNNPNSDYMIDIDKLDYLLENPPLSATFGKNIVVKGKYEAHPDRRPSKWRRILSVKDIEALAKKLKIGIEESDRYSTLKPEDRCDFQYFLELAKQIKAY